MYRIQKKYILAMLTVIILIGITIFARCAINSHQYHSESQQPKNRLDNDFSIINGVADLSSLLLIQNAVVQLNGDWYFWPNELLDPLAVHERLATSTEHQFTKVPGAWSKQHTFSNNPDFVYYGTIALEVILPQDTSTEWAIRLPNAETSCSLFVNSTLLTQIGSVSTQAETSIPSNNISIVPFFTDSQKNLIVMQISNYFSPKIGTWQNPVIGKLETISIKRNRDIVSSALVCGALFFMGVYHLSLYVLRRKDKTTLLFALMCICMMIRNGIVGERIFLSFFSQTTFGWRIAFMVEHISAHIVFPLFFYFLNLLFPKCLHKLSIIAVTVVGALWIFMQLFFPPIITHRFLSWYEFCIFIGGIYVLWVIIKTTIKKEEGAFVILLGVIILLLTAINDVLLSSEIIESTYLSSFGMFFFLFAQSFFLSQRYASLFSSVESYALTLENLNNSLARFIPHEMLQFLSRKSICDVELGDYNEMTMTVFFLDIRNFTARSENLTPSEVFIFINNLLEQICPTIRENGGFIDKYLGDGFMALFPCVPDYALNAALCINKKMKTFNETLQKEDPRANPVSIGIGIHTGALMLGTIGEEKRMDPTVISDTVNTASRLEQLTKTLPATILISDKTVSAIMEPEKFNLCELGEEKVKGKQQLIKVYSVQ